MGSLNTKDNYLARDKDFKFVEDIYDGYEVEGKGKGYFKYVGKSKVVEIPHVIQGHEMTSYYGMFKDTNVEKVISKNENITDMSYMFQDVKTDKLDLYEFDTSNTTNMSYMFCHTSINKLDLYNFNTEKVVNMECMFIYSKIDKLNISNFDTSNVTNMSYMFYKSNIMSLDLSSFNTSSVTNIHNMFQSSKAESIVFSGSFNTSNVANMRYMFMDSNTKVLNLSSFDTSNVVDMFMIFNSSNATIGYARTQEDANKFNKSEGIPKNLKFIVKPKDR